MDTRQFKMTGLCPLLMHNIRLANPLDPVAREMKRFTSKASKLKTLADYEIIQKLEWFGGLYTNARDEVVSDGEVAVEAGARVIIPASNIESVIVDGAKKARKGKLAKAGIIVEQDAVLDYAGSNDVNKLYSSGRFVFVVGVRNQSSRIMRTRPIFREWSVTFTASYDARVMNESDLMESLTTAGREVGIGDWRPKFGRFSVEKL